MGYVDCCSKLATLPAKAFDTLQSSTTLVLACRPFLAGMGLAASLIWHRVWPSIFATNMISRIYGEYHGHYY